MKIRELSCYHAPSTNIGLWKNGASKQNQEVQKADKRVFARPFEALKEKHRLKPVKENYIQKAIH